MKEFPEKAGRYSD